MKRLVWAFALALLPAAIAPVCPFSRRFSQWSVSEQTNMCPP